MVFLFHTVVICYVDDLLFFSKSESSIDTIISNLKNKGIQIYKEGSAEGFLGIDSQRVSKGSVQQIKLTQNGLTKRIVEALGLCSNYSNSISTPAENAPLPKDTD